MSPTLRGQSDTPRDHMVSHTGRCFKEMTQALAEQAVEVTSDISHLLEGAKETPQLLDNISQLERCDILLPSRFHSPDSKVLGLCVISTFLCNQRPSGTSYTAYCLQRISGFDTFPSTGG